MCKRISDTYSAGVLRGRVNRDVGCALVVAIDPGDAGVTGGLAITQMGLFGGRTLSLENIVRQVRIGKGVLLQYLLVSEEDAIVDGGGCEGGA